MAQKTLRRLDVQNCPMQMQSPGVPVPEPTGPAQICSSINILTSFSDAEMQSPGVPVPEPTGPAQICSGINILTSQVHVAQGLPQQIAV